MTLQAAVVFPCDGMKIRENVLKCFSMSFVLLHVVDITEC